MIAGAESSHQNPNHMVPPIHPSDPPLLSLTPPSPPPPPPPQPSSSPPPPPLPPPRKQPSLRVTTEFDSDTSLFFHKISCKVLEGIAKLKVSFQNNNRGEVSNPQVSFVSKVLSLHYDVHEHDALVKSSFGVGPFLSFNAAHDVKAQQGELAMTTNLGSPGYALELATSVPTIGLSRATLKFPMGEVSLEEREREEEEVKRMLSVSGIVKSQLWNGIGTAQFIGEDINLRYCYKDAELSVIPSISLPSNALTVAFKRRFNPSNKLSYMYNFDTNNWSSVYKHTHGKDFKFKAGYDSEVRLGWASLWVGDEAGKAKLAPMKMKVQFMLQVPQDDIKSSALIFRVKKRWDI